MIAFALVAALALGQQGSGPDNGGVTRGNFLRIPDYKTTAAQSWFVNASTGNDSFDCRSASTPCLTIQGAVNKVPKLLRDGVTVTVAAGSYTGFTMSGFICDPGVQTATGGIMIDGFAAFTNSTLATGSATGTFTASSAGSGTTFGTGTDGAATWTVNDLVGRFVTSAGQTRVIASNTATAITIVGTWTSPGAVAYTIQDPGVNITTAISQAATPLSAASANAFAVQISGNNCATRSQAVVIRGVRISNGSGGGIFIPDTSLGLITLSQIRNSNATSTNMDIGAAANASTGTGVGRWDLTDVDFLVPSSGTGIRIHRGLSTVARAGVRAGSIGLSLESLSASVSVSAIDLNALTTPVQTISGGGLITAFSGAHITCATGAGVGILLGSAASATPSSSQISNVQITGALMATCGTGIVASGPGSTADLIGLTGSAATTGMLALGGGSIAFQASTTTMTGGTNDISLDTGGATATLADVATGTCLTTASLLSKVCSR